MRRCHRGREGGTEGPLVDGSRGGVTRAGLTSLGTRTRPRRAPKGHSSHRDHGGQRISRLTQKTGQPKAGAHRGCTRRAHPSLLTDTAGLGRTLRIFGGNGGLMAGFCFYRNPPKGPVQTPKGVPNREGGGSRGSQPPEHSQSRIPPASNSPTVFGSSKSRTKKYDRNETLAPKEKKKNTWWGKNT